jgi:RHS repeat-associated protein
VPQITDRGFTGHEHLDAFGLINMNWRMYDPVLGRFLGDDPIIQAPDFSQSFNLYSYCVNNPLANIDPSGYKYEAPFQEEEQRELSNWSLEYLMLIHKLNNTDLTFAEKLDYLNGIDPQVIEIIYRLRKNQGNQSLIDVTDKFNTTINNTRQYFSDLDKVLKEDIIDPVMRHAFKLWIFANLVKTGAPFDLKNNEYSAEKIGEKSLFNNIEVRYDSYGNYNYGVAARAFGITLKEALAGAGINEVFKGDGHPDFTNLNGFFDTKSGSIDIIRGYFGLPFR